MHRDDDRTTTGEEPPAPTSPVRRYDAFHVRVWSTAGAERSCWLRVEVRHLQTDLVESATGVPPGWLLDVLLAFLDGDSPVHPADATP